MQEGQTLLEMLKSVKATQDATLSFRHACGSGICGSCTVRANGRPVLACVYKPEGDAVIVEPIEGVDVLRDLITDETVFERKQIRQRHDSHRMLPCRPPSVTWNSSSCKAAVSNAPAATVPAPSSRLTPTLSAPFYSPKAGAMSPTPVKETKRPRSTPSRPTGYGTVSSAATVFPSVPRGSTPRWISPSCRPKARPTAI